MTRMKSNTVYALRTTLDLLITLPFRTSFRRTTSITIPESITIIGPLAFSHCTGLSSVEIPESVTVIGSSAFWDCNSLISITVLSQTPPSGGSEMFSTTNSCPIYVPAKSFEAYKTAQYWSDYADRIQAIGTPQAIDLGLPSGLKWASFNLGATKPEEYGDYYAWGETDTHYIDRSSTWASEWTWKEGRRGYNWESYKWCNGSNYSLTKYCTDNRYGTVDNKTVLEEDDDVARVTLGGGWRIPTDEEWTELRTLANWTWTMENGVKGYKVTGPNKNCIFLPAAGDICDIYMYHNYYNGYYWSSSLATGDVFYFNPSLATENAWYVGMSQDGVWRSCNGFSNHSFDRTCGLSVRPVYAE